MIVPRTKEEIKKFILGKLGYPVVKVELSDEHVEIAYNNAVRWFISRKGYKKSRGEYLSGYKEEEFVLPSDVDDVVNVVPPGSYATEFVPFDAEAAILGMEGVPIDANFYGIGNYSRLVQDLQYREQTRRILGGEFTWEWDADGKILYIYNRMKISGKMIIEYIANNIDLVRMNSRVVDLIVRRGLCEAKEILGRIRSKYSEWPMAGGPKSMDGDTLLGEAREDKERLDEEIDGLSYPISFLVR
jgi:hypothetical protein